MDYQNNVINPVIKKLKEKNQKDIKESFIEFINNFLTPSFGSLPKKEIEILIFGILFELGVLEPDLYKLIQGLKITRQKAKNLLYEYNLRAFSDAQLEESFIKLLGSGMVDVDKNMILLQTDNMLLIDYLKSKLRNNGDISDGSFSPDIIKIKKKAFVKLLQSFDLTEKILEKVKSKNIPINKKDLIIEEALDYIATLNAPIGEGLKIILENTENSFNDFLKKLNIKLKNKKG